MSTHDRPFAAKLLKDGTLDAAMVRYNVAHPGSGDRNLSALAGFEAGSDRLHRNRMDQTPAPSVQPERWHVLSIRALKSRRQRLPDGPKKPEGIR